MLASDIRSSFLKFFESKGHRIVESSSVVPQNDPSLLFTNAGMVQFKNVFTGLETREYTRATSSQKCIRAGGKHNDLDQVGFTARHHTFFEMLGNFSFGDYFKEDAISFAWTFLTKELGLPKDKLLATVYHTDEEAAEIWKKVAGNIPIIRISTNDNFWSMGDVGPCGPCSEIFYDHGEHVFGGMPGTKDEDGDRYMEIWNIVFMQFESLGNGEKIPLKKKSIDTGMGLERISAVMQGVDDNYEIDLFKNIIDSIKQISGTNFENTYPSYKVIADHIRSVSFLISDGIVPSNEGRGYVLRRILRRAMRHGRLLGIKDPFLFSLSNTFIDVMREAYPALENAREMVKLTIQQEEEKFLDTLDRGLKILQQETKVLSKGDTLSGDVAFKLYDTYGFPVDLTCDILKSDGISVDLNGFESCLEKQRESAQWAGSGEHKEAAIWHKLKQKFAPTKFVGYEKSEEHCEILDIVQDNEELTSLEHSGTAFLITEQTPFYAECGGQCGDTGTISTANGVFKVKNTQKFCNSIIAHEGELISGKINVFDSVKLQIDVERREKIMANHTATHLMQAALRKILGEHVMQMGSSLNDERLRFDFSNKSPVSEADLQKTEDWVNEQILKNLPVICSQMEKNEAISEGAMALFGEKYDDVVRTVKVADKDKLASFELCGGTHVSSTGKLGMFKIVSESGIGSGLRRIEAITGMKVLNELRNKEKTLRDISSELNCSLGEVQTKLSSVLQELKEKSKKLVLAQQSEAFSKLKKVEQGSAVIYSGILENFSVQDLRSFNDFVKGKIQDGIVILLNNDAGAVTLTVSVTKGLKGKYKAGEIIKKGLEVLNGKGGGNDLYAQGAGTGNANAALDAMCKVIL